MYRDGEEKSDPGLCRKERENNAGTDLNEYGHMGNVILYVLIFSDPV